MKEIASRPAPVLMVPGRCGICFIAVIAVGFPPYQFFYFWLIAG
jgi:hypothetical protein